MSSKLSYEEAMGISTTNPYSQFIHSSRRKHIKLMPKYIGNVKIGVKQQLDSQVFIFSKELGGVPVAYKNIQLVQNMGRIIADQSCVHFDILADFILFKPQIGCTLSGVVNKVGKQHLGCLVHGKFNAWLPRCDPLGQNNELIGQEIRFVVTDIFTNNDILSVKGTLTEESLQELKRQKRKKSHSSHDLSDSQNDDIQLESLSQFEKGASLCSTRIDELSPQEAKKHKRKKDKNHRRETISETVFESQTHTPFSNKSETKKHKKNKHSLGDSFSEIVSETKDNGGDSHKSKKRKKHYVDSNFESFTQFGVDENDRKAKKRRKHSLEESNSEAALIGTVNDETSLKKPKEKQKNYGFEDSFNEIITETSVNEQSSKEYMKKKKKRKKDSLGDSLPEIVAEAETDVNEQSFTKLKKKEKKRKKDSLGDSLSETVTELNCEIENELNSAEQNSIGYNIINSRHPKYQTDDVSNVSVGDLDKSDKSVSQSDEGYHSKKSKKKHKRKSEKLEKVSSRLETGDNEKQNTFKEEPNYSQINYSGTGDKISFESPGQDISGNRRKSKKKHK